MPHSHSESHTKTTEFPRETAGLPEAEEPEVVELATATDSSSRLRGTKRINDATVRMLAYNGSVPGPTLKLPQGATFTVHVTNRGDLDATVHWHGLRLENRYDGTHDTQAPVPVGETFTYEVHVPDAGAYWYHRTSARTMAGAGLYGNILVTPSDADYWPPAHRELLLTLDDLLIEDGRIAPSASRRRLTWRWDASGTSCSSPGSRTSCSRRNAARWSVSTSRTRPTHASST